MPTVNDAFPLGVNVDKAVVREWGAGIETVLEETPVAIRDERRAWLKAQHPLLTVFGDSKTEDGIKVDPATPPTYINSTTYGTGSVLASLFRVYNNDSWIDTADALGVRHSGANRGKSSQTTAQLLSAFDGVMGPRRHQVIWLNGPGVNDFWLSDSISVATYVANMEQLVIKSLAVADKVVVSPIHPVMGTHADFLAASTNRNQLDQSRGDLLTMLAPYLEGGRTIFFDTWAAPFGDGTSYGINADYYYDGLHPNTLGNHVLATMARDTVFRRLFANIPAVPPLDDRNALENYALEGSGGTAGSRTSGTIPAGFTAAMQASGNLFATVAVASNAEGSNRAEVTFAPSVGALSSERFGFSRYGMAMPSWLAGKWARGVARVEFSAWNAWRGAQLSVDARLSSDVISAADGVPYNAASDKLPSTAFVKTLLTPPFIVPSNYNSLSFDLGIWMDGTLAGTGTVFIDFLGLHLVPDPGLYRGYA